MQSRAGLGHFTQNVGHACFVAKESSQKGLLGWLIFGKTLDWNKETSKNHEEQKMRADPAKRNQNGETQQETVAKLYLCHEYACISFAARNQCFLDEVVQIFDDSYLKTVQSKKWDEKSKTERHKLASFLWQTCRNNFLRDWDWENCQNEAARVCSLAVRNFMLFLFFCGTKNNWTTRRRSVSSPLFNLLSRSWHLIWLAFPLFFHLSDCSCLVSFFIHCSEFDFAMFSFAQPLDWREHLLCLEGTSLQQRTRLKDLLEFRLSLTRCHEQLERLEHQMMTKRQVKLLPLSLGNQLLLLHLDLHHPYLLPQLESRPLLLPLRLLLFLLLPRQLLTLLPLLLLPLSLVCDFV